MNKIQAALAATGVIICVFLICVGMVLIKHILPYIFLGLGLGFMWKVFYNTFKK
jgi:hypothetical protein